MQDVVPRTRSVQQVFAMIHVMSLNCIQVFCPELRALHVARSHAACDFSDLGQRSASS